MARKNKIGIDYFSHDSDLFYDSKIKYLYSKFGLVGYAIYLRLLESIYRDSGYYMRFNERDQSIFASEHNITETNLTAILSLSLNENLFSEDLHSNYQILTSRRIQSNFLEACLRRQKVEFIREYLLINPTDLLTDKSSLKVIINSINDSVNINPVNDDINSIESDINSQIEIEIEKEIEIEIKKEKENSIYVFSDNYYLDKNELQKAIIKWCEYKSNILKTPLNQEQFELLQKQLKQQNGVNVIANIEHSIISGYKGIVPAPKIDPDTLNQYNHGNSADDSFKIDYETRGDFANQLKNIRNIKTPFQKKNGRETFLPKDIDYTGEQSLV